MASVHALPSLFLTPHTDCRCSGSLGLLLPFSTHPCLLHGLWDHNQSRHTHMKDRRKDVRARVANISTRLAFVFVALCREIETDCSQQRCVAPTRGHQGTTTITTTTGKSAVGGGGGSEDESIKAYAGGDGATIKPLGKEACGSMVPHGSDDAAENNADPGGGSRERIKRNQSPEVERAAAEGRGEEDTVGHAPV